MVSDKPPHRPQLSSLPPETGDIDASWDDEPFGLELDGDEFDRATVVPDEPVEEFAARQMAEARDPFEIAGSFPTDSADFAPDSLPPLPSSPPGYGSRYDEPGNRLSPPTPVPSARDRRDLKRARVIAETRGAQRAANAARAPNQAPALIRAAHLPEQGLQRRAAQRRTRPLQRAGAHAPRTWTRLTPAARAAVASRDPLVSAEPGGL